MLPGHELMTPGAGGGQLKYLTSTPYTQHAADQFQPPLGLATPSPYQVDLHSPFIISVGLTVLECENAWRRF